jgi:prepilin-type N-terminal cleavage/methylation domain-containing protein
MNARSSIAGETRIRPGEDNLGGFGPCGAPGPAARVRRDGGFTLLELMVAIALFACATVAIALALQSSYRTELHAQNWTIAYKATQKALEEWLSLDFADIVAAHNAAPSSGIVGDPFVIGSSPATQGHVKLQDYSALWGGSAHSAFEITAYVDDPIHQIDVQISTVRSVY